MLRAKRTPVGQRKSKRVNRLNRKTGERVRCSPKPQEKRRRFLWAKTRFGRLFANAAKLFYRFRRAGCRDPIQCSTCQKLYMEVDPL